MEFICIGKIVNTHGIKGELRILSDFRHKEAVFKKNMAFYVGKNKDKYVVNSYRHHKVFDMVVFNGITNINEVEFLKGSKVYVNIDDIKLKNEFFSYKLIGFSVIIDGKIIGEITEIINTPANEVLRVGKVLIPYVPSFIVNIDEDNKTITIKNVGGLL